MALNFPSSPSNNQIYFDSASGNRYKYNADANVWFFTANNDIQGATGDTQVVFNDGNSANGSYGLTFNKTANTLTANTINAYSMRVTGNLYIGSNTVVISNNSIMAEALYIMDNGSPIAVPTGTVSNASYTVANAAFAHTNTTLTHSATVYAAVNSVFDVINSSYTSINAGYTVSNSGFGIANAAYGHSNTTYTAVNSVFGVVNSSYTQSNADSVRLSAAYVSINAGYTVSNSAYAVANAAYDNANNLSVSANAYAGAMANSANAYTAATYVKLTAGQQTITGDVSIAGNLSLLGSSTIISSNNLSVGDSLIYLAANNYSGTDIVDIGFIANYGNTTGANVHTGLVRDATDKQYYLFSGYDKEPANNTFVPGGNNMVNAVLVADINTSNLTLGGANAITWIKSAYDTVNAVYTSSNAAFGQVNTLATSANAYASAVGTSANAYTVSYAATIANAAAAFGAANSKVATVAGTSGRITSSGTTGITLDLATAGAGAASYSSGISALTVDAYGRVTAITGSAGYLTGITSGQVTTALGYTPPQPGGTGASGTWGISISGSAASATTSSQLNGVSYTEIPNGNNGYGVNWAGVTDMSTAHKTGWYSAYNPSNAPGSTYYTWMNVNGHTGGDMYGWQLAAPYWGTELWFRKKEAGAGTANWQTWRKIVLADVAASGIIQSDASVRAPIFYDSNNTGYYTDPASTSNLSVVTASRLCAGYNSGDNDSVQCSNWFRSSGASGWYNQSYSGGIYMTDTTYVRTYGSKIFYCDQYIVGEASVRSRIFYDYDNTGYYVDPNGSSLFLQHTVRNLYFTGVGGNSGASADSYSIYQDPGAWNHPYPDLVIGYHTGIKIGGYYGYNGTRFYNNTPASGSLIASIGDGDNAFRSYDNVIAYASDKRLKENIELIPNAIEKVMSLNGVTFDWKDMVKDLGFEPSTKHEAGVLAQEVEAVLPEAVEIAPFDYDWKQPGKSKSGEKYLTVKYEKLVPLLIEGMKDQQRKIDKLEKMIEEIMNDKV